MDADAERGFRDFVALRGPALVRFGFLLTGGDQHAAEDLVQSALSNAVSRWEQIQAPEAYIRSAMYRNRASWWRRLSNRRERVQADPPDTATSDPSDLIDLRLTLRAALQTLGPRQRAVLVLRYLDDLGEQDVARILGISVGTVRSTAFRSLALLRSRSPELSDLLLEEVSR